MARYRHKDSNDLAWNRIRRKITRELDTEIQNRREEALNYLLDGAWREYETAVGSGRVLELEAKYERFLVPIVNDIINPAVEAATVDSEVEDHEAA